MNLERWKLRVKSTIAISGFIFCLFLVNQNLTLVSRSIQYFNSFESEEDLLIRLQGPILSDDPRLISHLKLKYLTPPSQLPYNLTNKFGTDQILSKFIMSTFQDYPTGFFIEAGALDGEIYSNTLWLEVEKKWSGLLIEPNPSNCRSLLSRRRKAYTSCSCLTPHRYGAQTILEIPFQNDPISQGNYWLYRATARSIESRFHNGNDGILKSSTFSYVPVQCFPLQSYLFALNITSVDLLSLDTQGGEKSMLLNFPFDKIAIKYIIVEYFKSGNNPSMKDEDFIMQMKFRGFRLISHFEGAGDYIFTSI